MTATLAVGIVSPALLNPLTLSCLGVAGVQLSANLTAALALQASVSITPPTLAVQLAALLEAEAALRAGIALGLPGITFSVSAAAELVANARLNLGLLAELILLLEKLGLYVYSYSGGTLGTLGADLAAGIVAQPPPGLVPSSPVAGIVVGAGASTWPTVSAYFGGL